MYSIKLKKIVQIRLKNKCFLFKDVVGFGKGHLIKKRTN